MRTQSTAHSRGRGSGWREAPEDWGLNTAEQGTLPKDPKSSSCILKSSDVHSQLKRVPAETQSTEKCLDSTGTRRRKGARPTLKWI